MSSVGIGVDFTSLASALSTAFAVSIATQSFVVYRRTEREHFLALSVGFSLLAISFALLIPLAFGITLPTIGYESSDILSYPPRIVISPIGFIIIALSYSPRRHVKGLLYGLLCLLILLVGMVIDPQLPPVPQDVNILLYVAQIGLLSYVLYQMSSAARPIGTVSLGFVLLLLSQCAALADFLQTGEVAFFVAQSLRLASFALLVVALVQANRTSPIERRQTMERAG